MKHARIVYLNGETVPESEAKISFQDSGFLLGCAVYEATRTFAHKPFKLKNHIDRLYRSMHFARIDPEMTKEQMEKTTLEVLEKNLPLIGRNEDYWIYHYVSRGLYRGLSFYANPIRQDGQATILIYCLPIEFGAFAKYYLTGVHAVTPSIRRDPPMCLDPKMKTINRLNCVLAELEARLTDPEAWSLILDIDGNIAENKGGNFFIVKDGGLRTPGPRNILCGISRQTVLELAAELKIPAKECDLQVYDAINADEAFFTTTSYCILPVTGINGLIVGDGVPGPITKRLLAAWSEMVGVDIVQQALSNAQMK